MAKKKIVLVGNPNVGKSLIFNHLTGRYVTVSNYPGTTVDVYRGHGSFGRTAKEEYEVVDSPGINSLTPRSEDEQVARDLLLNEKPDQIIQIADAKNLRRTLILAWELSELEIPLFLCLNMSDEAKERGIRIDTKYLEKLLGIPVVETIAITGEGIVELKRRIPEARVPTFKPKYSPEIEQIVDRLQKDYLVQLKGTRGLGLMLLSGDTTLWPWLVKALDVEKVAKLKEYIKEREEKFTRSEGLSGFRGIRSPDFLIFTFREQLASEIVAQVQRLTGEIHPSLAEKFGRWTLRPFPGYLILIGVIFLMYEFVGVLSAGTIVTFLEGKVFNGLVNPFLTRIARTLIPIDFIQDLLVGNYGIFTMALTYSFGIILPIVTAFFLLFGLMEDLGYFPRLSIMLDRIFKVIGLNGKAVLPMVLGLGCDTMATLGTRILDTKKERLIATLLLALTIPCSAQLGVILAMLSALSWQATVVWISVLVLVFLSIGWLAGKVLSGVSTPFLVEIPPIRRPSISNVLTKVKMRVLWYLKEAVPLFILGTFILFLFDKIKFLIRIEHFISPVIVHWVGLPAKTTEAFVIGFLRRDYGAAGLYLLAKQGMLNPKQMVVSLVVITLFVPCIAQFLVTIRERGLKIGILIFLFCFFLAFLVGGILNFILNWVKII